MNSIKKIIELHDNQKLKYIINDNFDAYNFCIKVNKNFMSYIEFAVYCNNFEAYIMFINHKLNKKFTPDDIWLRTVFKRYESQKNYNNTRYLDKLLNLNVIFNPCNFIDCYNIETVKKFIELKIVDTSDPEEFFILVDSLYDNNIINIDIELFFIEWYLTNKPELLDNDVINDNILDPAIYHGKIKVLELLLTYNIDIKYCDNIPSIIQHNFTKKNKKFIDYLLSKNYFYEENLLNKGWFVSDLGYYFEFDKFDLFYIIDNFHQIKKYFREAHDNNYELLNHFLSFLITNNGYNYIGFDEIISKKLFNFLIELHPNKNENIFDKIKNMKKIENIFSKKYIKSKECNCSISIHIFKTFINCLIEHKYEPNERFSKIINLINNEKYMNELIKLSQQFYVGYVD
jgi:hypothetical protein